jgi:predicted nucleotidyltransferase
VFGSRATGQHKRYSDVDLLLSDEFSAAVVSKINATLEDSNLPYTFDLVRVSQLEPSYRSNILSSRKLWLKKQRPLSF